MAGLRGYLLVPLALVGIAAFVTGLLLDSENFLVGVLGSVVSLATATIAAVLVFDNLAEQQSERRRMRKWNSVRVATLTAIWEQVRRMTAPIAERSPKYDTFAVAYASSLELMDGISEWIPTQAVPLDKAATDGLQKYEGRKADMVALHGDVFREYVYLREVLTPRVLELADDARLTELLIDLDAMERHWSGCALLAGPGETQSGWEDFPVNVWTAIGDFYAAAVEVLRYVASIPNLPPPQGLEVVFVSAGERRYVRSRTIHK